MIDKNIKKLLLFITLCILLIGIVSATDVESNTTTEQTHTISEKITKTTDTVSEVKENVINDNKEYIKKDNYNEDLKTSSPTATKISIDPVPNVSVDDSVFVSGTFTDVNNNPLRYTHLKVDVNGEAYYSQTDNYGDYFGEYLAKTPGTKTITVSWAGNTRYTATSSKRTFNVDGQYPTRIVLNNIKEVNQGETVTISGNYYYEQSKPLRLSTMTININGAKYYAKTNDNGYFSYSYKTNKAGTNTVTVSYPGNTRFKGATSTKTFNVKSTGPQYTYINLNNIKEVNMGEITNISGYYYYDQAKPLRQTAMTININGNKYYSRTNDNGYFSFNYKTNKAGTNTVTVSYPGNTRFKGATSTKTFNVKSTGPQYTYINLNNIIDTTYEKSVTISGYYYYGNDNPLKSTSMAININGERIYAKTDNNGYFRYDYITEKIGKNVVNVSYAGNSKFLGTSTTKTFNVKIVNPINTYITIFEIPDVKYGQSNTIEGYYEYGIGYPLSQTTLTLNINGQKIYTKTDNTGYFKYSFKPNKLGRNTVTASYAGNSNFKGTSSTESFTVYNLELYVERYTTGYMTDYRIGNDYFRTWYQTFDAQNDRGVYVECHPMNMQDMGDPSNYLIIDTKFVFIDDDGYTYSDSFEDGYGNDMYHSLVYGYTPYKVLISYRKMTDHEKYLWNNGYGYNPFTGKWYNYY